jgi:hypothetical protein
MILTCQQPHRQHNYGAYHAHDTAPALDQLIIAVINMPPHGGWWANHSGGVGGSSVGNALVHIDGSSRAIDAELEHRRLGEDDRITIKCHRERRHNLEGDYGTPVAAPVARATHTPSSPGVTGGCMAHAPHLCMVVWPHKFWPHLFEKYNGSVNSAEFL